MPAYKTPICPKCNTMLEYWGMPMTPEECEGFRSCKYQAYYCTKCWYHKIYDFSNPKDQITWDDNAIPQTQDFYSIIDFSTVDELINRAISKRCFIEVISLINNTLEIYLKSELKRYWHNTLHPADFTLSISDRFDIILRNERLFIRLIGEGNGIRESVRKYLILCKDFNIIEADLYKKIYEFNEKRNIMIHMLLKEESHKYIELKDIAILGIEIKQKINPTADPNYTPVLLSKFKITEEEKKEDGFLR